jgi:hypothetical protein
VKFYKINFQLKQPTTTAAVNTRQIPTAIIPVLMTD